MRETRFVLDAVGLGTRLDDVSLSLSSGECVVLTGPNGAGKSSLIRVLLGLERPERGQVRCRDVALGEWHPRDLAAEIAWLPQRPSLAEPRRVVELVAQARFRFLESEEIALGKARALLNELGAGELASARSDRVSGGEFQRVLLATLLAQEAPLLCVDEPANHLDPKEQIVLYQRLGELWQKGHGLLLVTHDLRGLGLLGDPTKIRIVGLHGGKIAFEEQLASPALPARLADLYGVPHVRGTTLGEVHIDWDAIERGRST